MKQIIENLAKAITKQIADKLFHTNPQVLDIVLKAHNRHAEDEHDGADYIFNLNDKDDLKCCIDCGMKAEDIARLNQELNEKKTTPYFLIDRDWKDINLIATNYQLADFLTSRLDEVVLYMIALPQSYKEMHDYCIGDYIFREMIF